MSNIFDDLLKGIDGIKFQKTDDPEIARLKDLFSGKIPDMMLETFSEHVPAEDVEYGDFVFFGIERIIEENTDYIPGANIFPFGLFTFASTFEGDAIVFDSNDPEFPVYQCSHSLLDDEEEICFSKNGKIQSLPFSYENVIKVSARLADSFDGFVKRLISGDVGTYTITEMLEKI